MLNCKVLIEKLLQKKTKHLIVENQLKKVKTFDLGYFIGKRHFDEDGAQHYLVFQPILRYFTLNSNWITRWMSKGLSNESLEVVSMSDNTLTPSVNYCGVLCPKMDLAEMYYYQTIKLGTQSKLYEQNYSQMIFAI